MAEQKTIELNGKKYVEYDENKVDIQPAVETDCVIDVRW